MDITGFHQIKNIGNNQIATGTNSGTFASSFLAEITNGGSVGVLVPKDPKVMVRLLFYMKVS